MASLAPRTTVDGEPSIFTDRAPEWAARTFMAVLVGSFFFWLWIGRGQWFFQDEWHVLVNRDGGDLSDLFEPHNEHWSTIPVVTYRLLWQVFGLNNYLPYQVLAVLAHLAIAALLRAIMRRCGVSPWIATAAASAFALFGYAYKDIIWAFQMGFAGAVAFGLAQLWLADHDGPVGRRDAVALLAGLAALMSSGTGPPLVAATGLAMLVRRGWRVALLQAAPLAVIYGAWTMTSGDDATDLPNGSPDEWVRFSYSGLSRLLPRFTENWFITVLMIVITLAGLVLGARSHGRAFLRRSAVPLILALTAVVFFLITGYGRAHVLGVEFSQISRYAHVGVALILPVIALGADVIARRVPGLASALALVFVVGVVPGLEHMEPMEQGDAPPALILALAQEVTPGVADDVRPFPNLTGSRAITLGWLSDGVASGKIPEPELAEQWNERARGMLTLGIDTSLPRPEGCRPFTEPIERTLDGGDQLAFRGPVLVDARLPDGTRIGEPTYSGGDGYRLIAARDGIDLRVAPFNDTSRICEP